MLDLSSIRAGDVVTIRDGERVYVTHVSPFGGFFWGYLAEDARLHWSRRRVRYEISVSSIESIERAA